jgi:hypothetical protein
MKNAHLRLIRIFIITMALLATHSAPAQEVLVTSADPAEALQGTLDLEVTIGGSGFDNSAAVEFLVTGTTDPGGIIVKNVKVRGPKKIIVNVDVLDDAEVADFDIEVQMSGGRGGKGTTLFSVQAKPKQNIVNCDEFAPNRTCDCRFDKDADLGIFNLLGDCQTSETLVLTNARIVGFAGNAVAEWPILTAVNDTDGHFNGSAVITNTADAAGARYLNIRFDHGVSRGCDLVNDDIQTAISFVLDENTTDNPEKASGLQVWDLTIDTHDGADDDPLCTAIELIREPGFTTKPAAEGNGNKEGQVFVTNVAILDGSYERIGIRYEGMQPLGSINPPLVDHNVIGAQACGPEADTARAIQFGRVQLSDASDPSSQIAGVVESNTIRMATDCPEGPGGVGILVVGEPADPPITTAEVVNNDVSGAYVGVVIDNNVVKANLSGNTLTGDFVDESVPFGDIGVCSNAESTTTKGKPNKITGFDDKIIKGGCPTP